MRFGAHLCERITNNRGEEEKKCASWAVVQMRECRSSITVVPRPVQMA